VAEIDPDSLARMPLFRRVRPEDRRRVADVARMRPYARGDLVFAEGDEPEFFMVVTGRVKVFRQSPSGKDAILHLFGPGDVLGAVALYENRPYPASAAAVEDATCLMIPRRSMFALLEESPSLVRGLLGSLTARLVELTDRLAQLMGANVETRIARLFDRLADQIGRPSDSGVFIPLPLSRQELADLTGTTIETCIRLMSRWNKDGIVLTEKDGFRVVNRAAIKELGS
jgi:CRP/FNR family transcriptional regulator